MMCPGDDEVFRAGETFTAELEITTVCAGQPHVVILGAGASIATCPKGDIGGHVLPSMDNFIDVLGLGALLEKHSVGRPYGNFEVLYSKLAMDPELEQCRAELESRVASYVSCLQLPEHPTVYDHLVLSLRPRDVIATFNWDPLLVQALRRNVGKAALPRVLFLHGNVAVGYCEKDKWMSYAGKGCAKCGSPLNQTPLLYPVAEKNYNKDPFIHAQWEELADALKNACYLTIFGYGAPQSDVEAIDLMKLAWGSIDDRNMEQVEIIDKKPEDDLCNTWAQFIHTHHYQTTTDFYESFIARHPRRTGEAWYATFSCGMWEEGHPLPKDAEFGDLWEWYRPLCMFEEPEVTATDIEGALPL